MTDEEKALARHALWAATDAIGLTRLARRLGVSVGAVQKWRRTGCVPADRVLAVWDATGGRVLPWAVRPDAYDPEKLAEALAQARAARRAAA